MISALTLLLATRVSAPTPVVDLIQVDLAQIVESSNRVRYDLPESTTRLEFKGKDSAGSIREARRGEATHAQFRQDDLLVFETFDDGKRSVVLQFGARVYSEGERKAPRVSYAEATKEPLPELNADQFDIRFETNRGLILRSRPAIQVLNDEPSVTVEGQDFRRLTCRTTRAGGEGPEDDAVVEFSVLIDAKGLIRRVDGKGKSEEQGETTFVYTCEPTVAADEPFSFDVSRLKDWRKAGDGAR